MNKAERCKEVNPWINVYVAEEGKVVGLDGKHVFFIKKKILEEEVTKFIKEVRIEIRDRFNYTIQYVPHEEREYELRNFLLMQAKKFAIKLLKEDDSKPYFSMKTYMYSALIDAVWLTSDFIITFIRNEEDIVADILADLSDAEFVTLL